MRRCWWFISRTKGAIERFGRALSFALEPPRHRGHLKSEGGCCSSNGDELRYGRFQRDAVVRDDRAAHPTTTPVARSGADAGRSYRGRFVPQSDAGVVPSVDASVRVASLDTSILMSGIARIPPKQDGHNTVLTACGRREPERSRGQFAQIAEAHRAEHRSRPERTKRARDVDPKGSASRAVVRVSRRSFRRASAGDTDMAQGWTANLQADSRPR